MKTIELQAELREKTGKGVARRLRKEGKIPGVLYGKGHETKILSVSTSAVDKIMRTKLGMNSLIQLSLGKGGNVQVMIKDYQGNALSRALTHVDFLTVDENKELTVFIPVVLTGKAEGVTQGGILDVISREVELLCKAGHIPEEIQVDVTKLNVGQNIHLADVPLPTGSRRRPAYNPTIVTCSVPKAEEIPVAAAAVPAEGAAAAEPGKAGAAAAPAAAGKDGAAAPADAKAAPAKKDEKKK